MSKKVFTALLIACTVFTSVVVLAEPAPMSQVEREADDISATIMSPFCPGRTLAACPSGEARKLKQEIVGWLSTGESEEQVKERLLQTYGKEILGAPRAEGIDLLVWLLPGLFVLGGAALVVVVLKAMLEKRAPVAAAPKTGAPASDSTVEQSTVRQIEQEVRARLLR